MESPYASVDEVTPAARPLPTQPLFDLSTDALVFGGDPATRVIEPNGVHPLLHAIGQAFADHRPLVLSPDAIWLTITQGIAQHIRLHAEELRPRLVEHGGRERLTVTVDGPMPRDPGSWRDLVALLSKQLKATDLFECDFSTSTDVERMAGKVAVLDAYSPYFSYWMEFVCGIPSITFTGTVEDWRKIRARVDKLPGFGLELWHRSLVPVADQFVLAAQGRHDTAFWQRIYSPIDAYGGRVVTGWAARFYPYLKEEGGVAQPNSLLELPIDQPRDVTPDANGFYHGFYDGPGVRTDTVPATLSRVIVNINDWVKRENRVVALHAGLVAVAQDDDGALQPIAGWHLAPADVEINEVIDRIIRDHATTPPEPGIWATRSAMGAPADFLALYDRIGSASLFGGAWRLRPTTQHGRTKRAYPLSAVMLVIDLADGRYVGALVDYVGQTFHWVVCRVEEIPTDGDEPQFRLLDSSSEVPVYGTSLAMLLHAALESVATSNTCARGGSTSWTGRSYGGRVITSELPYVRTSVNRALRNSGPECRGHVLVPGGQARARRVGQRCSDDPLCLAAHPEWLTGLSGRLPRTGSPKPPEHAGAVSCRCADNACSAGSQLCLGRLGGLTR